MAGLEAFRNTIDGRLVDARDTFESYDPYTGTAWAAIPRGNAADVDAAVDAARRAFLTGPWSTTTPSARGKLLVRLADLIAENAERLAEEAGRAADPPVHPLKERRIGSQSRHQWTGTGNSG